MQKQNRTPGRPVALTAAVIAVMTGSSAWAQSTWTGSATDVWSDPLRWSAGVPNAVDAIANIDGTTTGKVMTDGVFTVGTLNLTRAVNIETSPTAFDPARGLTLSTSTGSPTIHVNGGDVFYYAGLFGTQGFTKTGNNKLTFRFNALNQTYSGDIRINAGILGINQNGSLGDDNNDLFIANGARLLAEPGSNSGLITLPSTRTITLAGAQSQLGSNNAAVNLVINGNIVEDAAGRGLVKTDAGVVTLAGTISYTGETRIAGGTLALSGSALLPSGQNLRFNQPAAATLDVGSTHQTVRTIVMDNTTANRTITGAAGSLTVNGPANLELRGNNGITYDFSGLGEFTYNRSTSNFVVQPVNVAAVTNIFDLNLAKSGSGGGTNTITAAQITIGGGVSDGNNGNTARVHLGTVNTFNADTISLGGFNAGAVVDFQSGLTSPSLKIRGTNGTSSAATVKIGETSSGTRRGEGVLNLTGGTIDALIGSLTIGRHVAGGTINDTSSLTMPGGTLVASSILLAEKTGAGTPTLTSTLTQGGGSVSTGTLTFGLDAGGGATARLLPTYNLNGGTLRAATLTAGGGAFASNSSRNLNLAGGTLTHSVGSDLTLTGLDTSLAGRLNLNVSAASVISADAGRTVTIGDHALLSGVAALTKSGDGTLRILSDASGYTGAMTVSAGTIGGTTTLGGSLNVSAGATLSPGASVGTFGVNGALTLASNATLRIEIDSDTAYDQLIAAGTVDLAGAQLQLVSPTNYFSPGGGGENVAGLSYTILNKTSSGAVSGTLFLGMTELVQGAQFSSAGTLWSIDYFGGDGNDIVLTSVPEPSMLGVLGLATLTLQRRRRSCPADPITS